MKRFVVVGLGRFGAWVARALYDEGFDVIALDTDRDRVDRYVDLVTRCVAADGTDPEVLRRVGAADADAAVISTGHDLAASILATMALRDLGVERIYVKASGLRAVRALERFGVTETIFPERQVAERLARRLASTTVLDYIRLGEGYSIQEMAIPAAWIGRTLRELSLPTEWGIQVVALYDVLQDEWKVVPDPDRPLKDSDIAIVAGADETLTGLVRELESG